MTRSSNAEHLAVLAVRYTAAHDEWSALHADAARRVIPAEIGPDHVADRLLVGGEWLTGPFRPVIRLTGGLTGWLTPNQVFVPASTVLARADATTERTAEYARVLAKEPAPPCPNSGEVFTREEQAADPWLAELTAGDTFGCGECDGAPPLLAIDGGLQVADHDDRGRPIDAGLPTDY